MKDWEKDLPRKQFEQFKKVEQSQSWFEVYDLGCKIYAIAEPYQFQEVISYLIVGDDKALLWDTGNGIGDMKKLVDELCDKELIVLNSHTHADHIGSNADFDLVHVFDHPHARHMLENGFSQAQLDQMYGPDTFSDQVDTKDIHVVFRRCQYKCIEENTVFDLGRRRWKVVYAPGHSEDSIVLVNEEEKIVMSGDTYYPAALYCFEENSFETYLKTMQKLGEDYQDYLVFTSHNEPVRHGKDLMKTAQFFEKVQHDEISFELIDGMKKYEWQGHSLIKK